MRPVQFLLLLAAVLWTSCAGAAPSGKPIVIEPQHVEIGLFYSGVNIEVRAEIPAGYRVAVRLMGQPQRLDLRKLGKKAGVLWMPMGDIAFENIPAAYHVLTSAPLGELGSPAVLNQWSLGYDFLTPANSPQAALRPELVRLKEHEGLFAIREGGLTGLNPGAPAAAARGDNGVTAANAPGSTHLLRGNFHLPARLPPGDYSVDVIGFDKERVVHLGHATLQLEHVGAVRALRRLAMDHGLLYGILASLIAIVVGLLTGLLFRPKSSESH